MDAIEASNPVSALDSMSLPLAFVTMGGPSPQVSGSFSRKARDRDLCV